MRTLEETRACLGRYIGQHSIHGVAHRSKEDKIRIYHKKRLPEEIKKSIENEASPHKVEFIKEEIPILANFRAFMGKLF